MAYFDDEVEAIDSISLNRSRLQDHFQRVNEFLQNPVTNRFLNGESHCAEIFIKTLKEHSVESKRIALKRSIVREFHLNSSIKAQEVASQFFCS